MTFEAEDAGRPSSLREMRRSYHDRIAEVRHGSLTVLRMAVVASEEATRALFGRPSPPDPSAGREQAARVESNVLALLALESPMARDLRVILASRDVTQLAVLCLGLGHALAERAGPVADVLHGALRDVVATVGSGTTEMLRSAEAAWAALDAHLATAVVDQYGAVQSCQTEMLTALIALEGVPMEVALDLAMVSRAYGRLADHAAEIADRVHFAVHGPPGASW